ncbi:PHB depolymerase family esterase [Massilia atriviolacea]|uniref:PHB depolymerase family esterase n=2 Tax=Massilia atriviolacea TaxID=2495579 RepID=A0A430HPZ4_9BURK|nr:PHB depolymerase family esterase [Massilia atriviolacea]
MRAATKTLMGNGPKAATSVIQEALKVLTPHKSATPRQPAAPAAPRDSVPPMPLAGGPQGVNTAQAGAPPPGPQPQASRPQAPGASHQDQYVKNVVQEATDAFNKLMPDMLAKLDRAGANGHAAFKMPHFDIPGMNGMNGMSGMQGGAASTPAEALPGKFTDGSFTNAAGTRTYKLYVPSSYDGRPMPLVVMLHGCTQDPDDFATGTQMNVLAEEMQCLVVYPAQSMQANSSRCWNWFNAVDQQRGQGEPSIIAGITETVMHNHAVDASQVYVAGLSAGGAMATIMGTLYPELYAAVGVHSGLPFASAHDLPSALAAMKGNFGPQRASGKSIPIIVFHGDKDTTVHPVNGDELIKRGAHNVMQEIIEPGRVPDGHAYTRTVHQTVDGTPQAEQWLIHGAGHAWSGGNARGSYTDGKGPDASREMMRFFQTKREA